MTTTKDKRKKDQRPFEVKREFYKLHDDAILNRVSLAAYLNVSPKALVYMQHRGELPKSFKFNGTRCYLKGDVVKRIRDLARKAQPSIEGKGAGDETDAGDNGLFEREKPK